MHEATYITADAQPASTGREVVGPQGVCSPDSLLPPSHLDAAAMRHRNRRPDAPMFGAAVDIIPTVVDS
jgi:hypothetical protein